MGNGSPEMHKQYCEEIQLEFNISHVHPTTYKIIHKKQSRNLEPMLGKQKWRSCSSQPTPRASKLLAPEPPSLFSE